MTSQYYATNVLDTTKLDWFEIRIRNSNKQRSKKLRVKKGFNNDPNSILESILRNLWNLK